ncbi:MAG: amidohydrolase [Alphaproteobacteria bacterium]|nr:amidohydrolase [Alphaproteobacteria bacterium]
MTVAQLPAGTWDTHVHVFEPDRFPYAEKRSYTPGAATLDDLCERHRRWGVASCVLVQPSVYGTDNACLLDALSRLGPAGRGVAVIDPTKVSDEALADLEAAGVVGLRVNLVASGGPTDQSLFRRTVQRLVGSSLFLQVYAPLSTILAQRAELETADRPVVLDHFAGAEDADDAKASQSLSDLVRTAPIWIKLSADYRIGQATSRSETGALDLVASFWQMMPDRLIWGSDWPHTGGGATRRARPLDEIEPFRQVYSLSVPQLLADAGLDEAARRRVLALNPAKLLRTADASAVPYDAAVAVPTSRSFS